MILERLPEVQKLSPEEKWVLVDELWASLVDDAASGPVDPEMLAELERRMAEYEAHPETATTWEKIRDGLLAQK